MNILATKNADQYGYKDIANKLNLVRHGYLYERGVLQNLDSTDEPIRDHQIGHGKSLKLFADSNKEQTTLRKKWIHRIFKTQDIPLS